MDNRIVIEPSAKIREIARRSLEGNWKPMFLGVFIYFVMLSGISSVLSCFFTSVRYIQLTTGQYLPLQINYASYIYELLVSGPLICGLYMFLLAYFRSRKIDYSLNFEGFSMFGKAFTLYLLFSVKVFLWSLLFVVPGIIATFRYSMCFYLRVDHPEWSASQCINESKRLMKGNKGKLFCLELSFIGWYFLAGIVSGIVTYFNTSGIIGVVIMIIASIPTVVVDVYSGMAQAAFYELVTGNLVVVNPEYAYNAYNAQDTAPEEPKTEEAKAEEMPPLPAAPEEERPEPPQERPEEGSENPGEE